jgi:hypothetical protein
MRRGLEQATAGERDGVQAPGRRMFLGVGVGCALPLIVAPGLVKASGALQSGQDAAAADPIWDHIASEAWRTCQEAQGPMGVRGEHVRRLASQIDLFAVHLRGRGLDRRVDDDIRRMLREQGRESAALEVIERHGQGFGPDRPGHRGRSAAADPARVAACLDLLASRGSSRSLRSRRAALDRLGLQLDREMAASHGRVVSAVATGQKPGDDFLGYPEQPPPNLCEMLEFLIVATVVLGVVLSSAGIAPGSVAAQWLNAACEALYFAFCMQRNQ